MIEKLLKGFGVVVVDPSKLIVVTVKEWSSYKTFAVDGNCEISCEGLSKVMWRAEADGRSGFAEVDNCLDVSV